MTLQPVVNNPQKENPAGPDLLKGMARLIQISRLYEDNNKLIIAAVKEFKRAVQAAAGNDRSQVILQIVNGRFFLQEEKLPLLRKNAKLFNSMLQFLEQRSLYDLRFETDLETVTAYQILTFFRLLNLSDKYDNPPQWLEAELLKNNVNWLTVILDPTSTTEKDASEPEIEPPQPEEQNRELTKKTYHYALNSVNEVAGKLLAGKETNIRKPVRMVQRMIDILSRNDTAFLSLSTIRMYDDYTFVHSLNVAILAMLLGKQLGLKHKSLEKLGLCGLFHDLGKIKIPKNILNKKEKLNDYEYNEIRKHSVNSALLILKLRTDKYRKFHLFVAPFEHHIRYDHSGYPAVNKKHPISLFGRILTIVDVYDAITSPRIYRPTTLSPDKALGYMLTNSGKHFDPVLLKLFINMLGVYPNGTLLEMDTGEMGIVLHSSKKFDRTRPYVQLLKRDSQQQFTKNRLIDLADRHPETGEYLRNIVKTHHPASFGIQPAKFII